MSILGFLGFGSSKSSKGSADTDTVRRIAASLDSLEPERARFIAAFAFLLCRVARVDFDVSAEEAAAMERLVMERGHLSESEAVLVLQIAKSQNALFGSTENFLVTREFAKIASREEKIALLDCLFAVSAADESISNAEDSEIVRICAELQLPREEVVVARSRYREHLAVLKTVPIG